MKIKVFISIMMIANSATDNIKKFINGYGRQISCNNIKWVGSNNLHLTAYFIGYIERADLPDLTTKIRTVVSNHKPFVLKFKKIVLAPPDRPATMLWAQYFPSEELNKLFNDFKLVLYDYGIQDRALIPHITLARFKGQLKEIPQIKFFDINVLELELVESKIVEGEVDYKVIEKFILNKEMQ